LGAEWVVEVVVDGFEDGGGGLGRFKVEDKEHEPEPHGSSKFWKRLFGPARHATHVKVISDAHAAGRDRSAAAKWVGRS
jgi:hypothetical protein